MKKYVVTIEELVSQNFEVFAESSEQAMEIAASKYKRGEFVLEPGELCAKQMSIMSPDDSVTEWIEF